MPISIFISVMGIFLIFNYFCSVMNPTIVSNMLLGTLTTMLATILVVGIISGIQILGSGLNSESIKIIFGVTALLNILFQVNIAGFPLGIGLANNVVTLIATSGDTLGIGLFIGGGLSIIAFVSGIMSIISGGD